MSSLILKRASTSRPSGEWSDDDYDVLANSVVVGRIMKAAAAPVGAPWSFYAPRTGGAYWCARQPRGRSALIFVADDFGGIVILRLHHVEYHRLRLIAGGAPNSGKSR